MNIKRWTISSTVFAALLALMVFAVPIASAAPPDGQNGGKRHRGGQMLATVAEVIGITADELKTELSASDEVSIADVAANHGVDVDTVIEALVTARSEHLAQKVADGELTQDEADERLAELETKITEKVNSPFSACQRQRRAGDTA